MTIPNFISIARLFSVPAVVWALMADRWSMAFALFVAAAVSDAVDGAIARHFHQQSTLGTYLDPIADKLLLVTAFVALGLFGRLPDWVVVMVVSRDVLIVGAVLLSFVLSHPVTVRPLIISKVNTASQIALAGTALAQPALWINLHMVVSILIGLTAVLTAASAAAYLVEWLRHMASEGGPESGEGGG